MDRFEDKRINDALELLNEVARDKKAELQGAIAQKYGNLRATMESYQQSASEAFHRGKEKVVETAKAVDDSAHKHPWPWIGGAALGALILGYLLGRSRRD